MALNKSDPKSLNDELETVFRNLSAYHSEMDIFRKHYMTSAFYQRKSGDTHEKSELSANLLRVFADKNIHYISDMPTIKVPIMGADQFAREAASTREKILYSVHRGSNTNVLQKKWAYDATIMSMAVAETGFDFKKRCAFVKRHDPRYVYWQISNDDDRRVVAFWAVWPISKQECIDRYGFTPKGNFLPAGINDPYLNAIDGQDWFTQAIRWDENDRVAWVGDRIIEEPHNHGMGVVPIDVCAPFDDYEKNAQGSFYLEPLLPLQAELNHTIKQRANIIRRMSNPVIWGRGILQNQFDDLKNNLQKGGGGFVGLKAQGELGLLQVQDIKLLDSHINDLITHMQRLSGFSSASFGESVGANTSGDALSMYFTPTEKFISSQQIHWTAFWESINSKILMFTEKFAKTGETMNITGYAPGSTVTGTVDGGGKKMYQSGGSGFNLADMDPRAIIAGNYVSIVTWPAVTPKDDIAEKTFWLNAANQKIISRSTAYDRMGLLSPQDELDLLTQEQNEPALNPDGTQKIMQSATSFMQAQNPQQPTGAPAGALPAATPSPVVANGA